MAKSWSAITSAEIDSESPITEALIQKFFDNQEAMISTQVDTRFDEGTTTSGSFTKEGGIWVWVPPTVATADGDVTLVVSIEVHVDGATSATARAVLDGGTDVDQGGLTDTAYTRLELIIPSADVKAAANTVVELEVWLRRDSGAGTCYVRSIGGASRFERAA